MSADSIETKIDASMDKHEPAGKGDKTWKPAGKLTYFVIFWLFMIGSVVGFILEGLWCVLKKGRWESHSATVWGPFCIIYGIGAAAVYFLAAVFQCKSIPVQFIVFSISGALVEYFGSLFQEVCFGTVSWDYRNHFLNLGGRVSLKMSLLWGILGIAFVKLLFPLLSILFEKMQGKGWQIACFGLSVFMAVDLLVSAAAVMRWRTRQEFPEATGVVIQWLDETFDDERMRRLYPNMRFLEDTHPTAGRDGRRPFM